jgi:hypothetical protein
MDRLDKFVENTLIPEYTRGKKREAHPTYEQLRIQARYLRQRGDLERAEQKRKAAQKHPSVNPNDPGYRRLKYVRYADDFLLGFAGPMTEAKEIKERISTFLKMELKLTLSAEKTLITHASTERARFLGYEIGMMESPTKFDHRRRRSVNGRVGMYIPEDVIQAKRKRYTRNEKVIHRPELLNDSEYDIIYRYQGEYRGLVNYYGLAYNLAQLGYLKFVMETSLLKTLARLSETEPVITSQVKASQGL